MAAQKIQIRALKATDGLALGRFLAEVEADKETRRFFHPHPLSIGFGVELCNKLDTLKDRYFALFVGNHIAGYGMLRGWDEGYEVPSFGVCVHPELQNTGIGHALTTFAIQESVNAGAEKLRLTVYKENERAAHLYQKYGFEFSDKDAHTLLGLLDLNKVQKVQQRVVNGDKLTAWAENRDQRPFRVGIWAAYSATLVPSAGIGVFVYNLIRGILASSPNTEVVLSIRHGDHKKVAAFAEECGPRLMVIPEADPEPWDGTRPWYTPGGLLGHCIKGLRSTVGFLRSIFVAPARALAEQYPLVVLPAFPIAVVYTYTKEILRPCKRILQHLERYTHPLPPPEREPLDLHRDARRMLCDLWVYPYYDVTFNITDHPSVLFVHDLVPSRYPEYFKAGDVRNLEHIICNRVKEATLVASMSEFIRQSDVMGLLGVPEEKTRMIRPTAPTDFAEPEDISDLLWSDRPYLFYPSGLRGYKNHTLLLEALKIMIEEEGEAPFDLIFTGGGEPHFQQQILKQAADLDLEEYISILGNVSREQLAGLYQSAFATVVPSLYEQGSFPLYEAVHYGCVIAAADIPSLREQCDAIGDSMVFFDPYDPHALVKALRRLQREMPTLRPMQIARAKQVWSRTWDQIAQQWMKIFRETPAIFAGQRSIMHRRSWEPNDRIRIGIFLDFGGTLPPNEGIGVHVHSLLHGFLDLPEEIELVILGRWGQEDVLQHVVRRAPDRVKVLPEPHQRMANWETIAETAGCHLWILPYVGTSWRPNVPIALILHDYVTGAFPEAFDSVFLNNTFNLTKSAIKHVEAVICLTDTLAEKEARRMLDVPEEKIRVLRPANPVLPPDGQPVDDKVLAKLKRPFLFYPGAFRGYKNHAALLHALRLYREEYGENPFDIVFTGPNIGMPDELLMLPGMDGLKQQVHVLGKVSRATLEALYDRAYALVFPSKYEGCGLPLYEAIDRGCPVVCSDLAVFKEQLVEFGDSILYFRPDQPRTLVKALNQLRENRLGILAAQQRHRDSLLGRSWADVAAEWVALAKELATIAEEVPTLEGSRLAPAKVA